jgi:hypothetical protein
MKLQKKSMHFYDACGLIPTRYSPRSTWRSTKKRRVGIFPSFQVKTRLYHQDIDKVFFKQYVRRISFVPLTQILQ